MNKKVVLLFLAAAILLTGCSFGSFCLHKYNSVVTKRAYAFHEGEMTYTCEKCGHSYVEPIAATKKLKLLMIGNSFSEDAAAYLWKVCRTGGLKDVTIAVAYIGGSTLDNHLSNIQNGKPSYEYQKNTDGNIIKTAGKTLQEIVEDEQWDVVTLQQLSSLNASAESLTHMDDIINWVEWYQPQAKIYYHMTWAHASTSTDERFLAACNGDTTKFHSIVAQTVQDVVVPNEKICGIIPSGTLIQNLRTSYLGEGPLYRDTLHLSNDYGRYSVALLWYACITGGDISGNSWTPAFINAETNDLQLIHEAVRNAIDHPFEWTPCRTEAAAD